MSKEIAIVVPTFNRVSLLQQLLLAIKGQKFDLQNIELFVVDDGSTDGTREFLNEFYAENSSWFNFETQANKGPAAARNIGIKNTSAPIILFTDDDCLPNPNWIYEVIEFLKLNPYLAGCGGKVIRKNNSIISRYIDRLGFMNHPVKEGFALYLVTANAAYRRNTLESVNGFSEEIAWPGGEDPDLSYRIIAKGGTLGVCKSAIVQHEHRDTILGIYGTFFNYGRGKAVNDTKSATATSIFTDIRYMIMKGISTAYRGTDTLIVDRLTDLSMGFVRAFSLCHGYWTQICRNEINKRRNV